MYITVKLLKSKKVKITCRFSSETTWDFIATYIVLCIHSLKMLFLCYETSLLILADVDSSLCLLQNTPTELRVIAKALHEGNKQVLCKVLSVMIFFSL